MSYSDISKHDIKRDDILFREDKAIESSCYQTLSSGTKNWIFERRFTMKKLRTVLLIVMVAMLVMQPVFAVEPAEANVIQAQDQQDNPAGWAAWDVQMMSTYRLGNEQNYVQFTGVIQGSHYLSIQEGLEKAFGVTDASKVDAQQKMTRGQVIEELFDIIQLTLQPEEQDALKYFEDNELIRGNGKGYALESECTVQELLVFTRRVYEFLVYARGMDAKGAFWKVSDEDNTVYLLGSIHATDGSVFPMSKAILDGFTDSEFLFVEANTLVPNQEEAAYMQEKMMYSDGTTIDKVISKEVYDKYAAVMQAAGMPPEVYDILKPWAAASVAMVLNMSASSIQASMGIDVYFLNLAYMNAKPIFEMEGIKFQTDMFESFTPELQEMYLAGSLAGGTESNENLLKMMQSWKAGDVEMLESIVFGQEAESEAEREFNEKLFDIRNANMVVKCQEMLTKDTENDYFVVVGAGHMINYNGIVKELIKLGYTVEQVK